MSKLDQQFFKEFQDSNLLPPHPRACAGCSACPTCSDVGAAEKRMAMEKGLDSLCHLDTEKPWPEGGWHIRLMWNALKEKVEEGLVKSLEALGSSSGPETEKCWENAAVREICERLGNLIEKINISQALSLLKSAQETFPEEELFEVDRGSTPESSDSPDISEEGEEGQTVDREEVKNYLSIFKNVFFESKKKPGLDLSQSLSEGPSQVSLTEECDVL